MVIALVYAVMEIGRLNARIENEEMALDELRQQVEAQAVELAAAAKMRTAEKVPGRLVRIRDNYVVDPNRVRTPANVDTPPRGYYEQINFMRDAVRRTLPATGK
jgi:hypothetical protein